MKRRTKKLLNSLKPKEKTVARKVKNAERFLTNRMKKSYNEPLSDLEFNGLEKSTYNSLKDDQREEARFQSEMQEMIDQENQTYIKLSYDEISQLVDTGLNERYLKWR